MSQSAHSAKSILEAVLFASLAPKDDDELRAVLPEGSDVRALLAELADDYDGRGVMLVRTRRGYAIRTRPETSDLASSVVPPAARLTRAGFETLAVIAAYHEAGQPVTRSEIERVRGVSLSPGIMDTLLAEGYIKPGRRRDTPGRPLTWAVTDAFYDAFSLRDMMDIEAFAAMREAGLTTLPPLDRGEAGADPADEETAP